MPWWSRWPTIATVAGALFALWGLSIGLDSIADNSFFTHLATGRILVEGSFPRHDVYSFTAAGEPWVVQSWLASLLYGWLDSWFGLAGIRLLTGALTAALGGLAWTLTRPARTLLPRIAVTFFVLAVGAATWAPRPLLFGLVLLAVTLLCVEGRVPPPVLLPVFWLWANLHGSFPLGLVAIACFALGHKLDGKAAGVEVRALKWAAAGTLAAVVGPLGPEVLRFPIRLLQRQDVLQVVVEWQSPSFSDTWARVFLLQVVIAVVVLVRRPSYRVAIPLVVFTAAALLGLRNVAVASLVLTPGLAVGLADLGSLRGQERGWVPRVGVALVVVVGLVVGTSQLRAPDLDLSGYPVEAVAWMDQAGLRTPTARVATSETVGNYLELLDGPEARVFIDDRVDLYPDAVIEDFLVLRSGDPGWDDVLDRRQIDAVLWERKAPLAQILTLDPDWSLPYQDDDWIVACRRSSAGC